MGSLKSYSNNANYHRFVKILKSTATRMQCTHNNQEDLFLCCDMGLKVREKRWTNNLGHVELIAKKTMEQPIMNQNEK